MLVLRILGVLTAILIASGIVAFLFTGERRYLAFSGRIAKYALVAAAIFLALLFVERLFNP